MYLSDTKIQELIDNKVLLNADASNIGQVTYDLRTDGFYINESKQSEVELGPGDSTFVSCVECIALPNDLTASVLLRAFARGFLWMHRSISLAMELGCSIVLQT